LCAARVTRSPPATRDWLPVRSTPCPGCASAILRRPLERCGGKGGSGGRRGARERRSRRTAGRGLAAARHGTAAQRSRAASPHRTHRCTAASAGLGFPHARAPRTCASQGCTTTTIHTPCSAHSPVCHARDRSRCCAAASAAAPPAPPLARARRTCPATPSRRTSRASTPPSSTAGRRASPRIASPTAMARCSRGLMRRRST
jgi:hypothetical protein